MRYRLEIATLLVFAACASEPDASDAGDLGPRVLLDHHAWEPTAPTDDPFVAYRPADVSCSADGARVEARGFEVDTGLCNYLSVTQPSMTDLEAGDELEIAFFHQDLKANEPAEAHIAMAIADDVVWELSVPIPSNATPYDEVVPIDIDAPEGTPITFHLRNHGVNNYVLLSVEVL